MYAGYPARDLSHMDESLDEWVSHLAETRNMSEDEVTNQLVSAFWVLDEMSLLSDGGTPAREQLRRPAEQNRTSADDTTESDSPDHAGGSSARDFEPSDDERSHDPAVDPESDLATDPDETPVSSAMSTADSDLLEDILDAVVAADESDSPTAGDEAADVSPSESSPPDPDVGDAIRSAGADDESPSVSAVIRTLAQLQRQVDDLALDLERQQSRQDQYADRITDNLTQLQARIETLETELGEESSEVDPAVVDSLKSDVDTVTTTVTELDSWVESEFDNIEQLFERLMSTTSEHEELLHELNTEFETLARQQQTTRAVHELQETAARKGVSEGDCANCEHHVNLGLLTSPTCPSCGATFTGVSRGGWNPFTSPTIETDSSEPPAAASVDDE